MNEANTILTMMRAGSILNGYLPSAQSDYRSPHIQHLKSLIAENDEITPRLHYL